MEKKKKKTAWKVPCGRSRPRGLVQTLRDEFQADHIVLVAWYRTVDSASKQAGIWGKKKFQMSLVAIQGRGLLLFLKAPCSRLRCDSPRGLVLGVSCRLCVTSSKLAILFWQHGTGLSILQASRHMKKKCFQMSLVAALSCRICATTSKLTILFWQHGTGLSILQARFSSVVLLHVFLACIYLSICICVYTITVQYVARLLHFPLCGYDHAWLIYRYIYIGEYACVLLCLYVPLCWRLSVYVAFANLYGTEVRYWPRQPTGGMSMNAVAMSHSRMFCAYPVHMYISGIWRWCYPRTIIYWIPLHHAHCATIATCNMQHRRAVCHYICSVYYWGAKHCRRFPIIFWM